MKKTMPTFFDKPWKHLLVAIIGFVLSYTLASWAIDSGRWTAYFGTVVFFVIAIHHTTRAIRKYARQS